MNLIEQRIEHGTLGELIRQSASLPAITEPAALKFPE